MEWRQACGVPVSHTGRSSAGAVVELRAGHRPDAAGGVAAVACRLGARPSRPGPRERPPARGSAPTAEGVHHGLTCNDF